MATMFLQLSGICLVLNPERQWPRPWGQSERNTPDPARVAGEPGQDTGRSKKEQQGSFVQSWGQPPAASTAARPGHWNSAPLGSPEWRMQPSESLQAGKLPAWLSQTSVLAWQLLCPSLRALALKSSAWVSSSLFPCENV